ncbi:MAG: glycosyltransferase, partial [Chloroflexota bacterium]|nr:glycosyltransferase [Chloroflexota bacterium]
MNLLFISGEYPPEVGGVADYTACLRRALAERGLASDVLSRRQVKRWDARALFELARSAPRGGIVHLQYQAAAYDLLGDICLAPVLLRALRPRVRVVTTLHDARVPYLFKGARPLRLPAVRLLARSSHAVIAADERDLRVANRSGARLFQVPIASNISCRRASHYDREAFRRSIGFSRDTLAIVYFGLLNSSKGLDVLVETFERVARARPSARLLMVGGGYGASDATDRATAARMASRLRELADRCMQTGYLGPADVSAHLLAADVALLP